MGERKNRPLGNRQVDGRNDGTWGGYFTPKKKKVDYDCAERVRPKKLQKGRWRKGKHFGLRK